MNINDRYTDLVKEKFMLSQILESGHLGDKTTLKKTGQANEHSSNLCWKNSHFIWIHMNCEETTGFPGRLNPHWPKQIFCRTVGDRMEIRRKRSSLSVRVCICLALVESWHSRIGKCRSASLWEDMSELVLNCPL